MLTEQYNAAVAEKRSAEAELSAVKVPERASAADIRKMVQELGDMTAALDQADASDMRTLYEALGLQVSYNHETRSAEVVVRPYVVTALRVEWVAGRDLARAIVGYRARFRA
ncbi:hypothetical protein ACIBL3_47015, partial [Kribbella sp. NPDC050124]|uniref:hypothetical protein n=1 Tax=Kribbella sp. NPDC050124 TaxID=3364114 RepID=UPI0037B0934B